MEKQDVKGPGSFWLGLIVLLISPGNGDGVLLGEPFGRLRNHLVHGLIAGINGRSMQCRACRASELMAEKAGWGGRAPWRHRAEGAQPLAVVIIFGAEMLFDNTAKVRRWAEGHYLAAVSHGRIFHAELLMLSWGRRIRLLVVCAHVHVWPWWQPFSGMCGSQILGRTTTCQLIIHFRSSLSASYCLSFRCFP